MDIYSVANEIEKKIRQLETGRKIIAERAEQKATAIANYDRVMAVTILRLRESGDVPVTLIDKVARGECFEQRLAMELAEGMYKSAISGIDSIRAELSGYQSIFKFMDEKHGI